MTKPINFEVQVVSAADVGKCPTCNFALHYEDNDDPLLNCKASCKNAECADPFLERYYEGPADADVFRKTDLWNECYADAFEYSPERSVDKTKLADHLYLKRIEQTSSERDFDGEDADHDYKVRSL